MTAVTPPPLKLACAIFFFPMRYIGLWDRPPAGFSDSGFALLGILEIFINGIFWGCVLVLLFRFAARFFNRK
jgi:hypothetical protein